MTFRLHRCLAAWLWLFLGVVVLPLRAHDPGISVAEGRVQEDRVEIATGFAPADVLSLVPGETRSGRATVEELETLRPQLQQIARELWELRAGETVLAPRDVRVEIGGSDNVTFHLVYPLPPGRGFTLRGRKIPELPSGHRQFVIVYNSQGSTLAKKLLRGENTTLEVPLETAATGASAAGSKAEPGEEPPPSTWWEFIKLGVEHIWTGYDHLLFLFALLLVCRTFRSIVAIISCFTLAHSITLGVATLGWVNLNSRFVEAAIAASIVFVGAENLVRRGAEPRGRWALTFAFGLIHGFGFASVLSTLGVGRDGGSIALPLLTFNLGVEFGQIAIAAVVLPIVWRLRKEPWFLQRGVPVLSGIVVIAGLYWLAQRTFLG